MARPNPHADPDVVRLRPGQVNPATGQRVRSGASTLTDEEIRRELEGHAAGQADEAFAARRAGADARRQARPPRQRGPGQTARPLGSRGAKGKARPSWSGRALGQRTAAPMSLDTDVTGFVLALMFWGWVVLPVLRADTPADGPGAVRDVLRAKFFNKGPDGEWLA